MGIDRNSSERFSVLRFPLVVGVVFIHAYGTNVGLSNGMVGIDSPSHVSGFIQNLISQGIARIAVPLFFLMSGYFFFLGFSWSIKSYKKKIVSRLKTLVVPFLFWNIFTLLLLALAQYVPATQVYFSGRAEPVSTFGVAEYANAIIGLTRKPISYQFWFIRDLMVMVALAPVIHLIVKTIPMAFLVSILSLWFFNYWPIHIPSVVAVTFFYAGAFFASSNISLFALDRFGTAILISYLVVLSIDVSFRGHEFNNHIHNVGLLLGIAAVLNVSKCIVGMKYARDALLWAGGCSFFVFAVHEPLLTVIKKLSYSAVSPNSDVIILVLYLAIPVVVIASSILLYLAMRQIMPGILGAISGGR